VEAKQRVLVVVINFYAGQLFGDVDNDKVRE
jgi:hypothetical protein